METFLLQQAMGWAVLKHDGQYRKGSKSQPYKNIPYVSHVFEVMKKTSELGVSDEKILVIAILHDIIEDCLGDDLTFAEKRDIVAGFFNDEIADAVLECSRDGGDHCGRDHKLEFLKTFKDKSPESIIVKIADRYCNVKDYLSTDKKYSYASTYALQAWPLYKAFLDRKDEFVDLCVVKLVEDCIFELGQIVRNKYDVNIFDTNEEEVRKHIL